MINFIKLLITLTILLSVTGCELDIFNDKELTALKEENRKLQLAKLKMESNRSLIIDEKQLVYQNKENLAKIEIERDLAKMNQVKELESLHLQNAIDKERLGIEHKNTQAQLILDAKLAVARDKQELKLYLIGFAALLLLIISFFVFYYFKKRREDKLRAYTDNLDKYFRAKENDARVKIAEKILDTISSGNLDSGHEARLIEVFNADRREKFQNDNLLEENAEDTDVEDAVIIDEKK